MADIIKRIVLERTSTDYVRIYEDNGRQYRFHITEMDLITAAIKLILRERREENIEEPNEEEPNLSEEIRYLNMRYNQLAKEVGRMEKDLSFLRRELERLRTVIEERKD